MCTIGGMLADLAKAIEHLDIAPTGDDLVEVLALRDRLDARIVAATGVFEANGCWAATPRFRSSPGCGPRPR